MVCQTLLSKTKWCNLLPYTGGARSARVFTAPLPGLDPTMIPGPSKFVSPETLSVPVYLSNSVKHMVPSSSSKNTYIFQLTASEASWVASLLCLGALWGAGPAGLISEYFGRKKTLLYLALPLVVSWILVASRYVLFDLRNVTDD